MFVQPDVHRLNFKSKIYGNQNLFQREKSLQERIQIQKGRLGIVQNEKTLFSIPT
jgi:hypothetical protein